MSPWHGDCEKWDKNTLLMHLMWCVVIIVVVYGQYLKFYYSSASSCISPFRNINTVKSSRSLSQITELTQCSTLPLNVEFGFLSVWTEIEQLHNCYTISSRHTSRCKLRNTLLYYSRCRFWFHVPSLTPSGGLLLWKEPRNSRHSGHVWVECGDGRYGPPNQVAHRPVRVDWMHHNTLRHRHARVCTR